MRLAIVLLAALTVSCSADQQRMAGGVARVAKSLGACDQIQNDAAKAACKLGADVVAASSGGGGSADAESSEGSGGSGRLSAACRYLAIGDVNGAHRVLSRGDPSPNESSLLFHCAVITHGCQRDSVSYLLRYRFTSVPPAYADAATRCLGGERVQFAAAVSSAPSESAEVAPPVPERSRTSQRTREAIRLFLELDEPRGAALLLAEAGEPSEEDTRTMFAAALNLSCHPKSLRFLLYTLKLSLAGVAERAAASSRPRPPSRAGSWSRLRTTPVAASRGACAPARCA